MKVSIVLPAYNEAARIERAVREVENAAKALGYDYEIIIAEDGSTDGTDRIAARIAAENPRVKHLHSDERLGRGKALMRAFGEASGDIVVYMDVDLATDLAHLKELVDAIVEGYDIATGSRLMKGSVAERPLKRDVASKVYNFLVRLFLGSKLRDHQCGFKAFRRDAILKIGELVEDNHWFWDTEVLVLAQRLGYRVKEIPVRWRHGGDTKVNFRRDVVYMFSRVLRMWLMGRKGRKHVIASTLLAIAIIAALIYTSGFDRFIAAVLELNPRLVLAAAALYSSSYALRGARYAYILRRIGDDTGLAFSTAAVSISQTLNVVTPVRIGDVARAYVFRRAGVGYEDSLGGVAVERIFDLLSIMLIAAIAAAYLGIDAKELIYAAFFTFAIIAAVFALSRMENFVGRIFKSAKRAFGFTESAALIALSSMIWATDIAVCGLVLSNFGAVNLALVSLAVAVGNIVKAIPVTPGGMGTYEAAVAAVLSRNYAFDVSLVTALVDHAVKNIATVILGLAAMLALNVRPGEVR